MTLKIAGDSFPRSRFSFELAYDQTLTDRNGVWSKRSRVEMSAPFQRIFLYQLSRNALNFSSFFSVMWS